MYKSYTAHFMNCVSTSAFILIRLKTIQQFIHSEGISILNVILLSHSNHPRLLLKGKKPVLADQVLISVSS